MKFTFTSLPVYTENLIIPLGVTVLPSNPTKGELYFLRSSGFIPNPLYRSEYIISVLLSWSTITLFMSNPSIYSVTIRVSSWDWNVPILLVSKKPRIGSCSALILLDSLSSSPTSSWGDMVIILNEGPVSLPGAAKIMLTVPNGGRGATSLW